MFWSGVPSFRWDFELGERSGSGVTGVACWCVRFGCSGGWPAVPCLCGNDLGFPVGVAVRLWAAAWLQGGVVMLLVRAARGPAPARPTARTKRRNRPPRDGSPAASPSTAAPANGSPPVLLVAAHHQVTMLRWEGCRDGFHTSPRSASATPASRSAGRVRRTSLASKWRTCNSLAITSPWPHVVLPR